MPSGPGRSLMRGTLSEARGVIETAAMAMVPQAQLLLAGAFNTQALGQQAAATTPGWERVDYRGSVSRAEVERLLDARAPAS